MKKPKTLFVGGTFDDAGGKKSKIARIIFKSVGNAPTDFFNGGYFKSLEQISENTSGYNLIYWFAQIPAEKPKLSEKIKKSNPHSIFVGSVRNLEEEYSMGDLIYLALQRKNNLLVEFFSKFSDKEKYKARILDPLGNVFLDYNENFNMVGKILKKRTAELLDYTRVGSEQIGSALEIPDEKEFFSIIRNYAEKFHSLIHSTKNVNRFFGNASFRCENGFPSFRKNGFIYVSKRNIDKRQLSREGFVAVKENLPINYFGADKPSVDAPVQLLLYKNFKNINYILHGHVYVENAPFTSKIIPCGALEEAEKINSLFDAEEKNFSVNLKGHGSLVLASETDYFKNIPFFARAMPEIHNSYLEKNEKIKDEKNQRNERFAS